MLLKAYRIRNDSCITYLYAVHSRQPGGGRCCSSDISFGFLKEASTCRIEVSFDVRFYHIVVRAKLQMTGEVSHRISCPNLLPVTVATRQKVWFIDGVEDTGYCHLEEFVLRGRDAQRAQGAVTLRDRVPSDKLRPVALGFDSLHERGDMVVQTVPIGSCTDAVYPGRRALIAQRPAAEHIGDRQHAKEIAKSVRLILSSFLRYSLQGGWHCLLQSFMSGQCFLCRLHHAVSPFLRTSTGLS